MIVLFITKSLAIHHLLLGAMLVVIFIFALLSIFYYEYNDYSLVENDTIEWHRQPGQLRGKKEIEQDFNQFFTTKNESNLTLDCMLSECCCCSSFRTFESSNGHHNCGNKVADVEFKRRPEMEKEADPSFRLGLLAPSNKVHAREFRVPYFGRRFIRRFSIRRKFKFIHRKFGWPKVGLGEKF